MSFGLSSGRDEKKKKEDDELQIPVLNIFLMKQIVEDDGKLELVGTFIQHCYEDDETRDTILERIAEEDKEKHAIKFEYRFNDETADEGSDYIKPRRTEKHEGTDMGTVYRHTYQVKAPLDVNVEFDFFPFRVVSAKLLVELSTFTTEDNKVRLRPDLILHLDDKTNMFCIQKDPMRDPTKGISFGNKVRGWLGNEDAKTLKPVDLAKDRLDRAETYDFISPFPKVSYLYDNNKGYCPKFLLKFEMVEDGMKKFVEIVAPMFLIAGMNTIHVLNFDEEVDTADYIANSATFALSVMVFLPTMVGTSRRQELFTVNNLYIVFIFISLTLSSIPDTFAGHKRWAIAGMLMNWISFIFPIFNSIRYWLYISKAETRVNAGHFWPTGKKNPYKAKTREARDLFASVGEVVNMKTDEERYDMEYKLRKPFVSKKMRVLEFASSTAVTRKNKGLKERSLPDVGVAAAAADSPAAEKKQDDPEKKDDPVKTDEAKADDPAAAPVEVDDPAVTPIETEDPAAAPVEVDDPAARPLSPSPSDKTAEA